MIIAKVIGNVVSSQKDDKLEGMKFLIVEPADIYGKSKGTSVSVASDSVGAGVGELVLCCSGSSARLTTTTDKKPVDLTIVSIIDKIDVNNESTYSKY